MTFTDPDTPDAMLARLVKFEAARDAIAMDGAVVRLRHNNKETVFSKPDLPLLMGMIRDLRGKLGLPGARPRGRRVAF